MSQMKQSTGRFVSPNEMLAAAKDFMLQGREPVNRQDWQLIVNFFAVNVASGMEEPCVQLVMKLYNHPLTEEDITKIVSYQVERKQAA